MKSRRTSLKIFIAAMMTVVLMVSFALTTFADGNENVIPIDYSANGYATVNKSLTIYNTDNTAIGSITFYFEQITPEMGYLFYQVSVNNGISSDFLSCKISVEDAVVLPSGSSVWTDLENAFCSGANEYLSNGIFPVDIYEITQTLVAELTIYKYNTTTHLLEAYKTVITLRFGNILPPPYINTVYTVWSATYKVQNII